MLLLRYEDVRLKPEDAVRTVAEFCDKELSRAQIRMIAKYVINAVREESPMGGWKDYFTVAQTKWFDDKYNSRLEDIKLKFKFM